MKYLKIEQKSPEWWALKVGKISGTKFGQLISSRENDLVESLANEALDNYVERSDYVDYDMQFGIDNEEEALSKYSQMTGITFVRGGVIASDFSDISIASPDGVNNDNPNHVIIVEAKCTMHGRKHLKRFTRGIDKPYLPQIYNYFVQSDDVKEVHWVSYCPFRSEREIIPIIVTLDTIVDAKLKLTIRDFLPKWRDALNNAELEVNQLITSFTTLEF